MKSHELENFDDWEDFDRIARVLEESLGWKPLQKGDGPDARICLYAKNGSEIWLVYDDLTGMALKCDGDSSHLSAIAEDILVALNNGGRK